jgi:hypothetical protein
MDVFSPIDVAGGMFLALIGYVLASRSLQRERDSHLEWVTSRPHVIGVVERLKVSHGEDTTYTPVIVYTLPDKQHYAIDGESSGFPKPPVGTEIEIAYDPAIPSTARIVSPESLSNEKTFGDVVGFAFVAAFGTFITMLVRAGINWIL